MWPCSFTPTFGTIMARKKISTTIYITPEQNEKLKLLHQRTKVPVAVYIREGIDLVLERHEEQLPGQLSLDTTAKKKKRSSG
jgi:predicted DNA-binding protein